MLVKRTNGSFTVRGIDVSSHPVDIRQSDGLVIPNSFRCYLAWEGW